MRILTLLALLLTLPLAAQERLTANTLTAKAGAPRPRAALADVTWLTGHWSGNALGGLSEEIWSAPAGGAMMGMYRLVRGEEVIFYELLTLAEHEGSLVLRLKHFNRDLTGWEEKAEVREFPLVAIRDGIYHFDGMAFRPEGDQLTVWLAIRTKEGVREEVFGYRRRQ